MPHSRACICTGVKHRDNSYEGLVVGSDCNLYVADYRVQVFSRSGRTFGSERLEAPHGIHLDHDYVYVTDWDRECVSVFTTSGTFITTFGKMDSGEGELNSPCGITTDEDGLVYVCDTVNSRVQVL